MSVNHLFRLFKYNPLENDKFENWPVLRTRKYVRHVNVANFVLITKISILVRYCGIVG